MERLQKYLASLGLGSRRSIENWIVQGRIHVNGHKAVLGDRIETDQSLSITLDGKPVKQINHDVKPCLTKLVLIYHKPLGVLCSRYGQFGRSCVFDLLPKPPYGRWVMVGRLDLNTSGLLLLTPEGELAHKLMHPSSNIERTYRVRIFGKPSKQQLQKLVSGVTIEGHKVNFKRLITLQHAGGLNQWYEVVVNAGRYRMVRKLWESQGFQVSRLIRTGYHTISLPKALKAGQWQWLSSQEANHLLVYLKKSLNDFRR